MSKASIHIKALSREASGRFDYFQCKKHRRFLQKHREDPFRGVQTWIEQMIKVLQYDFRYFQNYIGDMLSIFYETAYALLEADIANVVSETMPADTMKNNLQAAMHRYVQSKRATSAIEAASIPRAFFRRPWFVKASKDLASGFFQAGG